MKAVYNGDWWILKPMIECFYVLIANANLNFVAQSDCLMQSNLLNWVIIRCVATVGDSHVFFYNLSIGSTLMTSFIWTLAMTLNYTTYWSLLMLWLYTSTESFINNFLTFTDCLILLPPIRLALINFEYFFAVGREEL